MIEKGYNYLVFEEKPEHSFREFSRIIAEGAKGLCFTTTYPQKIKKQFKLENARMIWITEAKPEGQIETVNPKRLQFEITKYILEFIDENTDPVIFIDGFGYLILENGIENVRKFVKKINDKASLKGATVIIPVHPASFSTEMLTSLSKDFDRMEDFTKPEKTEMPAPQKVEPARAEGIVEDVFLVYNTGLLITHSTRRLIPNVDQEILSGMLTAIQEFIRDSFHQFKATDLKAMEFGENKILIERGQYIYLATVLTGGTPAGIQERMRQVILKIEEEFKDKLEKWDGSLASLSGIEELVKLVFSDKPIEFKPMPAPPVAPPGGTVTAPSPAHAPPLTPPPIEVKHSDWFLKGVEAERRGDYNEALHCYTKACEENPADDKAWFSRGVLLQLMNRPGDALECYAQALKINPADPEIWSNRGIALRALGRYQEAIQSYDEALKLNPSDASVWSNKGIAYRSMGNPKMAIECYDRALSINPNDAGVWSNKGVALQSLNLFEEALACYDRALQIDPSRQTTRKNREILLRQMGRVSPSETRGGV